MSDTKKKNVTRATFADTLQPRIGGNTAKTFLNGLAARKAEHQNHDSEVKGNIQHNNDKNDEEDDEDDENDLNEILSLSPMFSSTPPMISKTLVKFYPYLILFDNILSVITWTGDNIWYSVLVTFIYVAVVFYINQLIRYFGHIIIVSLLLGYSKLDKYIELVVFENPTLEDINNVMNRVSYKFDLLLLPLNNLKLENVERLLLTAVIVSPVHILLSFLILPPQKFLLIAGLFVITYHSPWSKVTRRLLWKFQFIRKLMFYITGLNSGGINSKDEGILAAVQKQVNKISNIQDFNGNSMLHFQFSNSDSESNNENMNSFNNVTKYDGSKINNSNTGNGLLDSDTNEIRQIIEKGKPIKFTYVLYENQRHWIGAGWKDSMLSYERAPWTDEFLNDALPPDQFKLPNDNNGMKWQWIDKTWRLDLTNDGAISISSGKKKTTADPTPDEGYIYYDNQWKKPSIEESFSKYTRRRRWVRTAELVKISSVHKIFEKVSDRRQETVTNENNDSQNMHTSISNTSNNQIKLDVEISDEKNPNKADKNDLRSADIDITPIDSNYNDNLKDEFDSNYLQNDIKTTVQKRTKKDIDFN